MLESGSSNIHCILYLRESQAKSLQCNDPTSYGAHAITFSLPLYGKHANPGLWSGTALPALPLLSGSAGSCTGQSIAGCCNIFYDQFAADATCAGFGYDLPVSSDQCWWRTDGAAAPSSSAWGYVRKLHGCGTNSYWLRAKPDHLRGV